MKRVDAGEKQRILREEGQIICYNDTEERAVIIRFKDDTATIKTVAGKEYNVNYDTSTIAGDAFVYGDVMTQEEYDNFPECVAENLSELSLEEIEKTWTERDEIESLSYMLSELIVAARQGDDTILCIRYDYDTDRKNDELAVRLDLKNKTYEIDLLGRFLQEGNYTDVSEDDEEQEKWIEKLTDFEERNPDVTEEFSNKYNVWCNLSDKSGYRLQRTTSKLYKKVNCGKRKLCVFKQHNPDSELLEIIKSRTHK